ncbi:hypothetical protein Tco_1511822, partial [Tanacetum coccineum]
IAVLRLSWRPYPKNGLEIGDNGSLALQVLVRELVTSYTKKENMSGRAERHERMEPLTADTKNGNMSGRA